MAYYFLCERMCMNASQPQTIRRLMVEVGTERPTILTHVSSNIL
jgi:hypothetical protein